VKEPGLRYVTARRRADGTLRYYWQRKGCPLTRLPDNPIARHARADALNRSADGKAERSIHGTLAWVIQAYKASEAYQALARSTRSYYDRYLREIESMGPEEPFADLSRRAVVDFIERFPAKHQKRQCGAVLKNLFHIATYHGFAEANHATELRIGKMPRRSRVWSEEEIKAWLGVEKPAHMDTAFMLLCYTAQRPSDVLKMTRAHYASGLIRVRQKKTDALLDVPAHPDLQAHLDALPKGSLMLVAHRARKVSYTAFHVAFASVCRAIGTDAQARDLRRTAMVNMALAGATVPQIASVSGHSIERTQQIIDTYIPRNVDLARLAVAKMPTRILTR
jgi:integrase